MKIINLLPKSRQEELYYERLYGKLLVVLWFSFASFLLLFAGQLGAKIYLQQEALHVTEQIEILKGQVSKTENEQIKKKIKEINDYIADYKTLAFQPKWSKVLEAFSALPPEEVGITSFNFNFANKSVAITGFAPTRESVIDLYNNILNDTENFYGINYPLENVAKPTNNTFQFLFFIKDELLK